MPKAVVSGATITMRFQLQHLPIRATPTLAGQIINATLSCTLISQLELMTLAMYSFARWRNCQKVPAVNCAGKDMQGHGAEADICVGVFKLCAVCV